MHNSEDFRLKLERDQNKHFTTHSAGSKFWFILSGF